MDASPSCHIQGFAKKQKEAAQKGVQLERDFYDGKAVGVFDLSKLAYANADLSALKAVFDLLQVVRGEQGISLYH